DRLARSHHAAAPQRLDVPAGDDVGHVVISVSILGSPSACGQAAGIGGWSELGPSCQLTILSCSTTKTFAAAARERRRSLATSAYASSVQSRARRPSPRERRWSSAPRTAAA